jgi:ubiquinone/menaquinone biosynthesis C-methylase UbiE
VSEIQWTTQSKVNVGEFEVPAAEGLIDGYNQGSGVKINTPLVSAIKSSIYPLFKLHNDLMVDGFIEWETAKLIKKYIEKNTVLLEVGCGSMSLKNSIPNDIWYNAFDLELSDFLIRKALRNQKKVNIALASATKIPVTSSTVSLVISTETFEHIPDIDKSIQEIHRILKDDGILICTIPNNFCHKYVMKGPHSGHINNWTYNGFIDFMNQHDFHLIEGFMKGRWIPMPLWLTKTSYQLPIVSKDEYYNTNFFYVFRRTSK